MRTLLFRIPLFLTLLALISCSGNADKLNSYVKYKHVDVDTFYFQAQQLPIDIIHAHCILAVDTFLILNQLEEEKIMQIYSLNTCDSLVGICRKGQGPDEFILYYPPLQTVYEDGTAKVWVKSIPNMLGLVNINESINQNKVVFEEKFTFTAPTRLNVFGQSDANFIFEDSVVWMRMSPTLSMEMYANPNPSYSKYNLRNNTIEKTIRINDIPNDPELSHMGRQRITYHPTQQKLASFYTLMGCFNIIDLEKGTVLKVETVEDGVNPDQEYSNVKEFHDDLSATDSLIWIIYENTDDTTAMRIYDWEGNLKGIAKFDKKLFSIDINLQDNMLYAIGPEDEIYKFDIRSALSKLS